jgi:hypothetical protein
MLKRIFAIIFVLACLGSTLSFAQDNAVEKPPLITFAGLSRSDLDAAPFRIEGFVLQINKCPPCPQGAQCKPCLGDHIVITDNLSEKDPPLIKRLRIFNMKPEQFELGKKYSFLVKVRGKLHEGRAIEEVDLIKFEAVETKPVL